jgi:hypothetical protein
VGPLPRIVASALDPRPRQPNPARGLGTPLPRIVAPARHQRPRPRCGVRVRVVASAISMEGDPARGLGTPLPQIAATALNPRLHPCCGVRGLHGR